MKTEAQYRLFDEFNRPKIFIVRDVIKGGVRVDENPYTGMPIFIKEEEDYIKFGEYTIAGFPFSETYFKHLQKLVNSFLQEINANKYDKTCNFEAYLDDLRIEIEKLMQKAFEDFHGLTRYLHFSELVHVDFRNVDYHWEIAEIPPDHLLNRKIHEFSSLLLKVFHDIQQKLTAIYTRYKGETEDTRINCSANRDEIQEYFYQLNRENGVQILTVEDINQFLQSNFQGFELSGEKRKLNPIGLTEADIRFFIYDFIIHFDPKGERQVYARLCKENFIQFEASELATIASNFSKRPKKYFLD